MGTAKAIRTRGWQPLVAVPENFLTALATAIRVSEKKGGERRSRGAEEQRGGGAEEEGRTDNFWRQSSRNPTQNFVHPCYTICAEATYFYL